MEVDEQRKPQMMERSTRQIASCTADRPKLEEEEEATLATTCQEVCNTCDQLIVKQENKDGITNKEYFDNFPPGYRFFPFDHELIIHYLRRKINDEKLPPNLIRHVNLYKHSPDVITAKYPELGENEWYFFTPRDRKYQNGFRPNRAAGTGYWKATGADRSVMDKGDVVGYRKALVFYEGRPPKGEKTNWIMHEFRVKETPQKKRNMIDMRLDNFVLCRIYKKTDKIHKCRPRGDGQNHDTSPVYHKVASFSEDPKSASFSEDNKAVGSLDSRGFMSAYRDSLQIPLDEIESHPESYGHIPQVQTVNSFLGLHNFHPPMNPTEDLSMAKYSREDMYLLDWSPHDQPADFDLVNTKYEIADIDNLLNPNYPPIAPIGFVSPSTTVANPPQLSRRD